MTAENIAFTGREGAAPARSRFLQTLGILGMIGAPMMSMDWLYRLTTNTPGFQNDPVIGTLGIFYIVGWMCTAIGMRRLRVTGDGAGSAGVFAVQIIGLFLALVFTVLEATKLSPPKESLLFQITDAAWPLSHVFMLVVGSMTVAAKVWHGWKACIPFIPPAGLLIFLIGMAMGQREAFLWTFPVFTTLGFLLLGNAVRTGGVGGK